MSDALADVLLRPGDDAFHPRCSGWNSRIVHRPDYIVAARIREHVQEAVRFAAQRKMPIYVQSTGHGALAGGDPDGNLDLGCVAAHGMFGRDADGRYTVTSQGKPATAFLLELIARLQGSATVPMIDVRAYARWLAT